ncbi:MAG TPA: PadR family transcriptional regulator [Actinomycetota bacterium]|jgi:DNA-binding PadR family transcriptional regulator|nr:PadR family transcriptional regulator [Actinomycetota bacterium]
MASPTPSTTTYALLGLLALRPWTGYELTRQLRRGLHYAWPRSEANVYSEQKQLVRLGWATVTKEQRGKRTRNRYAITPAGRRALRAWMRTEPDIPHLEVEGIVRMFFGDQGTVDDLVGSIRATGEGARVAIDELCDIVEDYFVTGGPFPERLHVIALAADLVTDLFSRIEAFTEQAASEIARWETTKDRGMNDAARRRFEAILARGGRGRTVSHRRRRTG